MEFLFLIQLIQLNVFILHLLSLVVSITYSLFYYLITKLFDQIKLFLSAFTNHILKTNIRSE